MQIEYINMKEERAKKRIIVLGLLLITIIAISGAYAFFTAIFTGVEDDTTITIGAGRLGLHMDGGNIINMNNIYPRAEAWDTKRFTITGNNNSALEMEYELSLIVTENTFSNNALTYTMRSYNTTNDGTPMQAITEQRGIPTGPGSHPLGRGIFDEPGNDMVHTYYLSIFFPSRGVPQNEDQGATFRAHVGIGEATNSPADDLFINFTMTYEEDEFSLPTIRTHELTTNINDLTYSLGEDSEGFLILHIDVDIDRATFDEIYTIVLPHMWSYWIVDDTDGFTILLFEIMIM